MLWPYPTKDVVLVERNDSEFVKVRRKNCARLLSKIWLENPSLCPSPGKEKKIISALTSPHQDETLESHPKSREEWGPPW